MALICPLRFHTITHELDHGLSAATELLARYANAVASGLNEAESWKKAWDETIVFIFSKEPGSAEDHSLRWQTSLKKAFEAAGFVPAIAESMAKANLPPGHPRGGE